MKRKWVNFTLPLAALTLVAVGSIAGCDKRDKLADVAQSVQHAQDTEGVTSEEDYDAVFEATTAILDKSIYLQIKKVEAGYIFSVISGSDQVGQVVCSESSASTSFGKSCRDYAVAHGCIIVRQGSSGWTGSTCP